MATNNLPPGYQIRRVETQLPDGYVVRGQEQPEAPVDGESRVSPLRRQLGLTRRAIGQGLAGFGDILQAPLSVIVNAGLEAAGSDRRMMTFGQIAELGLDALGTPDPETGLEKIVNVAGQAATGAAGGVGVGRALAAAPGAVGTVAGALRTAPGVQAASAMTGGAAAEGTRQAGEALSDRPGAMGVAGRILSSPVAQLGVGIAAGSAAAGGTVAAGRGVKAVGRGAGAAARVLTQKGQRRIVADVLRRHSQGLSGVNRRLAALDPTLTEQTTGAVSRDPGLLGLEGVLRKTDTTGRFATQTSQANLRRQRILDVLGGEDIAVSERARDASTKVLREQALPPDQPISIAPDNVVSVIDRFLAGPAGKRKIIRQVLQTFRKQIAGKDVDGQMMGGAETAQELYEIRKDINAAMQGQLDRAEGYTGASLAKSFLKQVKMAIDDEIESVAPGFKRYLEEYARLSKDIDQREIIQKIQRKATVAIPDPSTGREFLSQAKFRRLVAADLDKLTPDQAKVLQAIADDLDLAMSFNATGIRPTGSDTAKNLTVAHIVGRALGGPSENAVIRTLLRPIRWIEQVPEEQMQALLADAMLDPKIARELLQEATPMNVRKASESLATIARSALIGSTVGLTPSIARPSGQPPTEPVSPEGG